MLNHFGCGTFHDYEELDELCLASPKKSKKKDKNPYSTRGLDKFSALLSDLDEKRQRIYSQMNPHDISFVRFVHSSTNDFVPVVVKVNKNKENNHRNNKSQEIKVLKAKKFTCSKSGPIERSKTESREIVEEDKKQSKLEGNEIDHTNAQKKKRRKKKKILFNLMKKLNICKPCFYVPMVVILILMFLTFFGRTFATLCTCIFWYIVPILFKDRSISISSSTNSSSSVITRKSVKKKDYVRGVSEKKMVVVNDNDKKKKDYVRWMSESKIVVNSNSNSNDDEEIMVNHDDNNNNKKKKKDCVGGWSEKKIETLGLFSDEADSENHYNKSSGKHEHKKSW